MQYENYIEIVRKINESYGTSVEVEHAAIHEFFEGNIPLFKLLLSREDGPGSGTMIVSFHLDLDIPSAIQWFLRLRQLDAAIHLASSYLKDLSGVSHVGENAEILRMHIIEQHVVSNWLASDSESQVETTDGEKSSQHTVTSKTSAEVKAALAEFGKMYRKKSDTFH